MITRLTGNAGGGRHAVAQPKLARVSKRIVIEIPEPERVRVRYRHAYLTILREGRLYGTQLGVSIAAYQRGELGVEALSERFARSRVVDHTPSFSWENADWRRVLNLVVKASLRPDFEFSDAEHVAAKLADEFAAESKKMRETLDKLTSPFRGFDWLDKALGRNQFDFGRITGLGGFKPFPRLVESLFPLRNQPQLDAFSKPKPGIADQVRKIGDIGIGKLAEQELAWLGKRDALNLGAKAFHPKVFQLPDWFGNLPDPAPWLRQIGDIATKAAEAIKRTLPANWRELETTQLDDVLELMKADGYGLAWVPREEILRELLDARDHAARAAILQERCSAILEDIESTLERVEREDLQLIRAATVEAITTFRDGHPGPAQTYAATAIGELIHGPLGADGFGDVRGLFHDTDPMHDVELSELSFYALGHALVRTLARFNDAGDGFNRNLTTHRLGAFHNEPNLLMVLMLLTGLLVEVQRILDERDRLADEEAA